MSDLTYFLKSFFGKDNFRPGQREVVEALLSGRDVLALWPTGAGKSLTYQLPALIMPGLTVVVSPLIALMEDQVRQLQKRNLPAAYLSSSQSTSEKVHILSQLEQKKLKMLFAAPERLLEDDFLARLQKQVISLLAVDEAHCINQWGHDFRSSYLRLGEIVKFLRPRSILAVTATADPEGAQQISLSLGLDRPLLSRLSLDRPNLSYKVIKSTPKQRPWLALAQLRNSTRLPAVLYVARRNQAEQIATFFSSQQFRAAPYHAGLSTETRQKILQSFLEEKFDLIAATIAFGMGVDKPNIRQVIHMTPPAAPESYFQESGRAGRDRLPGRCLLMWAPEDFKYWQHCLEDKFPQGQEIDQFVRLASTERLTASEMRRTNFRAMSSGAWAMLVRAALGYEADPHAPTELRLKPEHLFDYFAALQEAAQRRLDIMENYCRTKLCRRRILLQSLAQAGEEYCGNCDNCLHQQRLLRRFKHNGAA